MEKSRAFELPILVACLVVCQMAGLVGSVFTSRSVSTWYVTLKKPFFTPPNWLFGPVWFTLYTMMGVSLFLVSRKDVTAPVIRLALLLFAIQLVLNGSWTVAFFGLRSPIAGVVVISVLWIAIVLTIVRFFAISVAAGLLLVPYIVWVSFAAALNFAVAALNR